ncbi:LysR family transcriptional regulator [Phaeobacter sp. QD34_3]|uniref:LysR family transcriptional regulator n=1 Tax=unclassified Phaeobacter TaxID=2621772 RepID=UPI00237F9431|nr:MULTISPECIES: LysR family transcriptional regulator [unclassified Phaeobacter]MDE4132564.1 LysR family transcriptional regulator [Phaeobacter sp. QD34_3]MDE4136201.1 LysR family transcriptional regulator [Phaeobacter sp. QD34_24]MDE4174437.1 LysR family transcriptional regulator [Phaeobacter sp. PT47_59]
MEWISLPPLAALRAFSAFAETGNVVKAGAALNVSHAAISQQLRALERHMGVALLERNGRGLSLTQDGAHLARGLQLGFSTIQTAVQDLTTSGAARPLHITCTPMFAAQWLMPRLAEFRALHPDVDLVLDPVGELVELTPGGIDIAVRYGAGQWAGLETEPLLQSPMTVVAAPHLLEGQRVSSPQDLLDFPWLEELGTTEATKWLTSRGVDDALRGSRIRLPGNLLMEAVRDGQGIAVSVQAFVAEDLRAGRLEALFTEEDSRGYHIATVPGVLRPQARKFISWLRRHRQLPEGGGL